MSDVKRSVCILAAAALVYFIAFPEDLESTVQPVAIVTNLTNTISPWFYGVVAVAVLSGAIVKTWGPRPGA
ncbi:MAG: hypothetical protein GC162_02725 [Planctomycetes bacterium]|nr:hypothetical protein [Planctomycetota bacterium]